MEATETPQGVTHGVEIIGMIGVQPETRAPGATMRIIGGAVDPDYVRRFAHAHEDADIEKLTLGREKCVPSPSGRGF